MLEYYSKSSTEAETKYHSYELETLAVFNAVKHFRHYLHDQKFVVYTDCNSLKASRTKIELTARDFDVQYSTGSEMAHLDLLLIKRKQKNS